MIMIKYKINITQMIQTKLQLFSFSEVVFNVNVSLLNLVDLIFLEASYKVSNFTPSVAFASSNVVNLIIHFDSLSI